MLSTMRQRFLKNFRDPVMRGNVLALMGGKLIGLTLLLTVMSVYLPPVLHAQAGAPSAAVNALNTVWVLIAAFLVFCMQVDPEYVIHGGDPTPHFNTPAQMSGAAVRVPSTGPVR